MNSVPNQFFIG